MSQPMQLQKLNIKEAEQKAWRSVFQDGLWDIFLGMVLLSMGTVNLLDNLTLAKTWYYTIIIGIYAVSCLVLWAGKRFITLPRLGRVKFGAAGKTRRFKTQLLLSASVVFGLIVWFLASNYYKTGSSLNLTMGLLFPMAYVLNVLLVFGLGAYTLDYPRLYIIAVLFAVPIPLQILSRRFEVLKPAFYSFAIPAGIIVVMGIACLIRFLRNYPIPSEPTLNEMG